MKLIEVLSKQLSKREIKKALHPRETVKDAMRVHRVELVDINIDKKQLRKFLAGKGKITHDMAKEFARVFGGINYQFFINLQKNYEKLKGGGE